MECGADSSNEFPKFLHDFAFVAVALIGVANVCSKVIQHINTVGQGLAVGRGLIQKRGNVVSALIAAQVSFSLKPLGQPHHIFSIVAHTSS